MTNAGLAAADAIRIGYAPLFKRNEFMYELNDNDLKGLIIEETGQKKDSSVVALMLSCIKALKKFANWTSEEISEEKAEHIVPQSYEISEKTSSSNSTAKPDLGLNLSYTINLNLPAASDVAVFNAIFKSLKEHLLQK